MQLKINQTLKKGAITFFKGDIISIGTDKKNVPLDIFWRARLLDAAIDNCVELVSENIFEKSNKKKPN